jgi:ketosteroid isomerase-like protein
MKETSKRQHPGTEEEIRKLEADARNASLAGDTGFFERVASDDFLSVDPRGETRTKAQMIEHRNSGNMKFHSIQVEDERVRTYGNAAVVTGTAHVKSKHERTEITGSYRYTRVYVKQLGRWRTVSSQSTRIG